MVSAVNCIRVRYNTSSITITRGTNGYSTTSIFDFWKEHENDFVVEPQEEIILLLGETKSGISTTGSFLVDDDLESIILDEDLIEYLISDKNDRISTEPFNSKTFVPEPLIDPDLGVTYYDCPGFSNMDGIIHNVATAKFLNKLLNSAKSTKLVFVINYMAEGYVDRFFDVIKQALTMIGSFEKFSDGIALVVTQKTGSDLGANQTFTSWDNAKIVKKVVQFLKYVKKTIIEEVDETGLHFSVQLHPSFKKEAIKFIDILLERQNDKYQRIGILRSPSSVGPLKDMEVFMNEKMRLKEIIHENLKYVPKGDTEFGYPLASLSQDYIRRLIERIIQDELAVDITRICNGIEQFFLQLEKQLTNIQVLHDMLTIAEQKLIEIDFVDVRSFIKPLIDTAHYFGVNFSNVTTSRISKSLENIDFLVEVSGQTLISNQFIPKLDELNDQIENSRKWYEYLLYLNEEFSKNPSQSADIRAVAHELAENCQINEWEMRNISEMGLERFLWTAHIERYADDLKLPLNAFELRALSTVLLWHWM